MHIAHEASLNHRDSNGSCERSRLKSLLRRGDSRARSGLKPKPFPQSVAYLKGWIHELHGRSGVGTHGLAPLTPTTIQSWASLSGNDPQPHEVAALYRLDAAMFFTHDDGVASKVTQ